MSATTATATTAATTATTDTEGLWGRDAPTGYYYHYKHDPAGLFNNYAYQVIGIGHHTEVKDFSESAMVIYRPLYETAPVYTAGKHYDLRPLKMFLDPPVVGCPRFRKVTDPETIKLLDAQCAKMYEQSTEKKL